MFRSRTLAPAVLLALAAVTAPAAAGPESTFTYQGSLSDAGSPADGSFNLSFSLWNSLNGGAQIGSTITANGQAVTDGVFSAELDFGTEAFDGNPRWLQVVVNGETLTPRQPVTRTPYAIQTRGITVDADNNVGIGTATPQFPLHVEAPAGAVYALFGRNNNESGVGLYGQSDQPGGRGVIGFVPATSGVGSGLFGQTASTTGRGVFGFATATTGVNFGVRGLSASSSGRGMYGHANAATGSTFGVYGQSDSPDGRGVFGEATNAAGESYGVMGTAQSPLGYGVVGQALSITGPVAGVHGLTASTTGRGVLGYASAATGTTYGLYGLTASTGGRGVIGRAEATTGATYGVQGQSFSPNGYGVIGSAFATTGTPVGVFGNANTAVGFDFLAGGAGFDYGSLSSKRWKNNVEPIGDALDKIARLRGVSFDWDADHGGHHDIGFIAEEVGKVMPEIVAWEEDGEYAIGLDYSKVTPLLVEAMNALRAESESTIDALQRENESLRDRLAALEAAVAALQGPHAAE